MNLAGFSIPGPLATYAALALLAAALVAACLLQRLNFKALERHLLSRQAEAERQVESLREAVARVESDVNGLKEAAALPQGPVPRDGFNLSKRSHALRMNRRGEGAEQIAAALNVPRQEIDLLLKVHSIVVAGL